MVRISIGTPAIMTYIFHDFSQLLHARAGIMPEVRPRQFSYTFFPVHYSLISPFVAMSSEILIVSLHKEITVGSWVGVDLAGISPKETGETQA